jgi:hypothetical protein
VNANTIVRPRENGKRPSIVFAPSPTLNPPSTMTQHPRLVLPCAAAPRSRPPAARILAPVAALLLAGAGAARATVLMDDDFSSSLPGTTNSNARKTLDVPRSAEWYGSTASTSLAETTGRFSMNTTGNGHFIIGNFTNEGVFATVPVGDTLTISFKFSLTPASGASVLPSADGVVRIGIFNSAGGRAAADQIGVSNAIFMGYNGYLMLINPNASTKNANVRRRDAGNDTDRQALLNSLNAYTKLITNAANNGQTEPLTPDEIHTGIFKLTRQAESSLLFEFTIKDAGGVEKCYHTYTDTSANKVTAFDTFAIGKTNGTIGAVTVHGLKVETGSARPVIVGPLGDRAVTAGDSVILSVTAASESQTHYQWFKDGAPIAGAPDSAVLRLPGAREADGGVYSVTVGNASGQTDTATGALTVSPAPTQTWTSDWATPDSAGRFSYQSDAEGNRIPDFSHAGYMGGGVELPLIGSGSGQVPARQTLSPAAGDNLAQIQAAIDAVGALAPDANGYRGAVLLAKGLYEVSDTIRIPCSGVVLAGEGGASEDATANTVIRRTGTGTAPVVKIGGQKGASADPYFTDQYAAEIPDTRSNITSDVVHVGETSFQVENPSLYHEGDAIIIRHPSTQAWIDAVDQGGATGAGAGFLPWQAGNFDLRYHRYITNVDEATKTLTVDAPVFNTLKKSLSQSHVFRYDATGITTRSAVDNVFIDIETEGPGAENHATNAVELVETENCWVRDTTARRFVCAGIYVGGNSTRATVLRCRAIEPHSAINGARRYNFYASGAQLVLFQECYARNGRHSFVTDGAGATTSGIVFLNCVADYSLHTVEGHRHWAQALLYDNVEIRHPAYTGIPKTIALHNRKNQGTVQSHGWSAVNSVIWRGNSGGAPDAVPAWTIIAEKPPAAQNYAIGCFGNTTDNGTGGIIEGTNQTGLNPASLYKAQLKERTTPPPTTTTITGITPGMFLPGESLTILGKDFPGPDTAATLGAITKVSVGGVEVPPADWRRDSDTAIVITRVPGGIPETGKAAITVELDTLSGDDPPQPVHLTLVIESTKSYLLTPSLGQIAPARMTAGGDLVFHASLSSESITGAMFGWEYFDGAEWKSVATLGPAGYATADNGAVLTLKKVSQTLNNARLRYTATIGNNPPLHGNEVMLTIDPPHSLGASALAVDRKGVIYAANRVRNTVEYMDLDGAMHILAGDPLDPPGRVDAAGRSARFNAPRGLALGTGTLFVADTGNNVVRAVDLASGSVATLAGAPVAVTGTDAGALFADGPAASARFKAPAGLARDSAGLLYIADSGNHAIRVLDPAGGAVTTIAGEPGVSGSDTAHFNTPLGLALSEDESILYVADTANSAIRAIAPAPAPGGGFVVTTLAGKPGATGATDGEGEAARFSKPAGVTVADGALYVADTENSLIRIITGGTVATLAGTAGAPGFRDGVLTGAQFNKPEAVAADARRDLLFIADTGNLAIRVLDIETGETVTPAMARAIESYDVPESLDKGSGNFNGGGAPGAPFLLFLLAAGGARFFIFREKQ